LIATIASTTVWWWPASLTSANIGSIFRALGQLSDKNSLSAAIVVAALVAAIKFWSDYRFELRKMRLGRLQDQIEQFYGPLFSIVDQLDVCFNIEHSLLDYNQLPEDQRRAVHRFMYKEYYQPRHSQVRLLLETRRYLVAGLKVPMTFADYLKHSMQEEVQTRLWLEHDISTAETRGLVYPSNFNADIERTLKILMSRLGGELREKPPRSSEITDDRDLADPVHGRTSELDP
jgi:hypothetical protein